MKADTKQKWLDALRSGRYRQGHDALCDDTGAYCCLGVLARVSGVPKSKLLDKETLDDIHMCELLGVFGAGYSREIPDTHKTVQQKLAGMNDNGKTFAEIAEWIEANIPADAA